MRGIVLAGALAALVVVPASLEAGHSTGHTNWTNNCAGCHGATPAAPQFNAGGDTNSVLSYVIGQVPSMSGLTAYTSIANYIATLLPAVNVYTPPNTAVNINVGNNLTLGGIAFTSVVTCDQPRYAGVQKGTIGSWGLDTIATYTPPANYAGPLTFEYRGGGPTVGHCRIGTINVGGLPSITSSNSKSGTVGVFLSYTISATNYPESYSHLGTLPAGLSRSGAVISGTPTTATTPTKAVTMRATNDHGTSSETLTFTIAKGTQVVTFGTQTSPRTYAPSSPANQFAISPLATSNAPGAVITYTSNTPTKCTVSGTTVTIVSVGDGICTIQANGAATANYNSDTATRTVTIVKADQTISFPAQTTPRTYVHGGSFPIATGTASSGLALSYTSTTPTICSVVGTNVNMLKADICTVQATQPGNGNYNAATPVNRNVTITPVAPAAPTVTSVTGGPNQVTVSFTPPTNTGGRDLTGFAATCTPSGGNTGASSPIVVSGLTNGVLHTCSVTATNNAALTSLASNSMSGTPSATPVAPTITSAPGTTFTVLSPNTFNVTATGVPAPTFSVMKGILPSGVTLSAGGVLSGTPASGTVGTRQVLIRASNGVGVPSDQVFDLTVARSNQAIDFTDPPDQAFSLSSTPLTASASPSGLAVSFTSATPGVCGISGSNATILSVGDCTINANQAGNADYNAAPTVPQTFTISQGSQSITFGAQTTASRAFTGGTFPVSPLATASSGLAVTYGSDSPGTCSVAGSTVTMLAVGTCTISATQVGNANWSAASPETQDVEITIGSQSITFAATQGPQLFVPGGTFALNPVGSASSGLAISYTTLTPEVCTVAGTTVTMQAVGTCTIAANQEGNGNYAAASQVTRDITINANVPGAPTIGTAVSAASGQLSVSFTAPANNGGSAITSYTATCTASGQPTGMATGAASPLLATGMTNGVMYACSVTATNAVGTGPASGSASGTPGAAGPGIWAAVCSSCHGDTPAGARFNAAGTSNTVLDYVINHAIANQTEMNVPTVTGLTPAERADLVAYISSYLVAVQATTAPNTPKSVNLGGHLHLNTIVQTFQQVEIVTPPSNGTLGTVTGTSVTYTPNGGFTGTDSFTYRGLHTSPLPAFAGDVHTATIIVDPNARVLTLTLPGAVDGGEVAIADSGGTQFCSANCSNVYPNGEILTLFATPMIGYSFTGWGGACSGTGDCVLPMSSDRAVTATFVAVEHALSVSKAGTGAGSVSSSPGGISCGATCSASFAENTMVTLSATPSTGSTFAGWSGGGCTGTGSCFVTMDAAKSVTATFTLNTYALSVSKAGTGSGSVTSSPPGIACGATCSVNFGHGTVVTLTAAPTGGSTFGGWSGGGCTGTGSCIVTMDSAKSVTATFVAPVGTTRTLTVARAGTGTGGVTSSPAGIDCGATCSAPFADGASVTLFATPTGGATFAGWSGDCTGNGVCNVTMSAARNVTATFNAPAGTLTPSTGSLDFGGQSMGTTSPAMNVTLTNGGAGPVTVTAISISSTQFTQTNDCTVVAAGGSCTVAVRFSPPAAPGLLNSTLPVGGTLNVTHSGSGSPVAVTVLGTGEKSLVTHYYYSILRRAPDAGGVPYWQGEAARVAGLGANVNETWFALAQAFYTSTEYLAFNRDATGFVTDLYATFFNRAPDQGGLDYWVSQMSQGLPREVVLVSFMFSPEFAAFTQGIFGNTAARAEVDTVVDFYRGLLSRLPDSGGFDYWEGQFREAQCQVAAAVYAKVEAISSAYVNSPEYAARGRSNAEFVGDMYNAFMRRGGDLSGVQYWIGQLDTGARTRENVRQAFITTPEFSARVQAIIDQGCLN